MPVYAGDDPYNYRETAAIIKELLAGAPLPVLFTVYDYSNGDVECARLLCALCKDCKDAVEVEMLVRKDPRDTGRQLYERLRKKEDIHGGS